MDKQVTLSTIPKRAIAFFIDEVILTIIFFIAFGNQIDFNADNHSIQQMLVKLMPYYIFMQIVYQTIFIFLYGYTIGKKIVKIKCVNFNNQKPTFIQSFVRSVFRVIGEKILYIGFLFVFFTPLKQCLHDYVAKTLVVND